jgi:cell division protein FtsQ
VTVMDPRVAERRKTVSEDRARSRLKWILLLIALVATVLGSLWLVRSPVLSIRQVDVTGAQFSDPRAVVRALGMDIGTATIDIDSDVIARSILEDPWVASATVDVVWPGSIIIEVTERTPVAPVLAGGLWMLVASDGGVIKSILDPGSESALVAIDQGFLDPGDVISDPLTLGALEFIENLGNESRSGARIQSDGEGVTAEIAGHAVRLGRPVDMAKKARVLEALLETGIEPGASIDLIAPLRPAVTNLQPVPEVEE